MLEKKLISKILDLVFFKPHPQIKHKRRVGEIKAWPSAVNGVRMTPYPTRSPTLCGLLVCAKCAARCYKSWRTGYRRTVGSAGSTQLRRQNDRRLRWAGPPGRVAPPLTGENGSVRCSRALSYCVCNSLHRADSETREKKTEHRTR